MWNRIYSRDELKQNDLRNDLNNKVLYWWCKDKENLSKATIGVDYVFHAAALKQYHLVNFFQLRQ